MPAVATAKPITFMAVSIAAAWDSFSAMLHKDAYYRKCMEDPETAQRYKDGFCMMLLEASADKGWDSHTDNFCTWALFYTNGIVGPFKRFALVA